VTKRQCAKGAKESSSSRAAPYNVTLTAWILGSRSASLRLPEDDESDGHPAPLWPAPHNPNVAVGLIAPLPDLLYTISVLAMRMPKPSRPT